MANGTTAHQEQYAVAPSEIEKIVAIQVTALQAEIDRRIETIEREAAAAAKLDEIARQANRDHSDDSLRVVTERLNGIDRATEVLNETVNRVPTDLQTALANVRAIIDEKFASVAKQFEERDTRSERESRDNKVAVDAAFAAQKEAAAKQDESNAKAIDKSEAATKETIDKLGGLADSTNKGLSDKIDDLKARVQAIESRKQEATSNVAETHAQSALSNQVRGLYLGIAGLIVTGVFTLLVAVVTHGFK